VDELPELEARSAPEKAAGSGSQPTSESEPARGERWSMLRRIRALIRLKPFDISDEVGRARERHRRALLSSGNAFLARIVSLVTPLVTIPLTLRYLGTERYGVWMTITAVVASLAFADLGIGNGLLNSVATAHGKDDRKLAQEYVSSAFFLLLGIALILAVAYAAAFRHLPWQRMFAISSPSVVAEVPGAVTVFLACFLVSIPLGTVDRVLMAYQEGFRTAFWAPFGSLLTLLLVIVAIKQNLGLAGLILAVSGSPVLVLMANGVFLFKFNRPWLLPRPGLVTRNGASQILKLGAMYFVIQLALMVRTNSGNIVIAQILGSEAVTQYAVPVRVFLIVGSLITILLSPIWPAYNEAIARGDIAWVRSTLRRTIAISLLLTLPSGGVLAAFGRSLITYWTGGRVVPSVLLLLSLAVWGVVSGVSACFAIFLMATAIRFQAISAIIASLLNLGWSIYLTRRVGIAGVVLSSITVESLALIPAFIYVRRVLARLR